jgi:hypothetical protein
MGIFLFTVLFQNHYNTLPLRLLLALVLRSTPLHRTRDGFPLYVAIVV